jgi:uncharacterized protein YlxP (DUF503 family)
MQVAAYQVKLKLKSKPNAIRMDKYLKDLLHIAANEFNLSGSEIGRFKTNKNVELGFSAVGEDLNTVVSLAYHFHRFLSDYAYFKLIDYSILSFDFIEFQGMIDEKSKFQNLNNLDYTLNIAIVDPDKFDRTEEEEEKDEGEKGKGEERGERNAKTRPSLRFEDGRP